MIFSETGQDRPDPLGPQAAPGNPLYRVLALYLPWSILVCLLPAILALLRRLLPALPLSGPGLALAIYLPALFVSAAVTLYLEFLDPRTSHSAAHIRGGILTLIAAYLLSSLVSFKPPLSLPGIARQFFPAPGNAGAVLASLYIWVFVIHLRDLFRAREIFEYHLRRHRGEELRRIMLEDASVMTGAEARIRSMTRHYSFQLGLVFILTLTCGFLRAPLSIFQYILTMLVIVAAAILFTLLNLFRLEQYYAGEGIAVPAPERRKRVGAGILFCAAAGILAALCASNNNLLPISIIAAFFAWLARLLSRPDQPLERIIEPPPQTPAMNLDPQAMIQALGAEETEPWPFWDYLPYIGLALAIAAFLWFMVKPLFRVKAGSDKVPFGLKVFRLIRGGLGGLWRALKGFFSSLGPGPALKITGGDLRGVTENLLSSWSTARKRELRQSLNLFARLILWGERNYRTTWKPSMGPGEFCALLAAALRHNPPNADHEGGGFPPARDKQPQVVNQTNADYEGGSLPPARDKQPQVVNQTNAAWPSANKCPNVELCGAALAAPARGPSPPGGAVLASPPPRGNSRENGAAAGPRNAAAQPAPPRRPRNPVEDPPPPAGEQPGDSEQTAAAILRCGEIFEEALYGPRPPDRETRREFRRLVEEITK